MLRSYSLLIAVSAVLLLNSCTKTVVDRTAFVPALKPSATDSSAGSWKTILLTSPAQISVPAPDAVGSANYTADLSALKSLQAGMTADQMSTMTYWISGNVMRWNETLRGLVAKYNLPPYQNPDGTYPIPSSANPFNYPEYPFSNPPYAARAYAYITAAQYDALVAAYHYKMLYARKAPYVNDSGVKTYVSQTSLPSYPSEAAVLAGVTKEMMKALFPTEVANINAKGQEAETAAMLSGAATQTDINAGDSLGRKVADVFIARAKTDNTSKAVGTPAIWASLITNTEAKGNVAWLSLETPKRPPMLPLFGAVKSLITDSVTLASLMPAPPPALNSDQMKADIALAKSYSNSPTAANIKVVQFWADGVGTATPPGHWNQIAAEDFISLNYSEVRWAKNMAFLNIAMMDAAILCWQTKYYYFNQRPSQADPTIKTLTGVPNFPAYISGHAMFSSSAAAVLSAVNPAKASDYEAMATEASNSRVVSGIHYKTDCTVGQQVGNQVGSLAVQRWQAAGGN